ncbi:MAG: multidrug effflux MFS transporter [Rhodobacteraceae bacterium]|nr:multidrug effflux MFS transporter [Paracoccaceae bacterium]MBR9822371.1 multidrug effflux MFS transporter [Paracoccaceae bacterium]
MPARTPPHLSTLIILTGSAILTINMFVPSLPGMARDFGVDYGAMSLVIGAYLLVTAVMQLLFGPLSDVIGRRPVILGGMAVFTFASALCALTSDITVFWIGRMLQAAATVGVALSRAVMRDQYEPRELSQKMSTVSMVMALGPLVGPVLGGVIDEVFGWRGNFAFYTLLGLAVLILAWVDLGETHRSRGTGFAAHFRAWPELLGSPRFWGYATCWSFSIATFHVFVAAAPLALSTTFGMGAGELGLYMATMSVGFMLGSYVSGQVARRVDWPLTRLVIIGRLAAALGLLLALVALEIGLLTIPLLVSCMVLNGLGNGLTAPNAASGVMAVRPHLAGAASGLSSAMIQFAGALATGAVGLVLVPELAMEVLLAAMLSVAVIGLVAGLWLVRVERRRGIIRTDVPKAGPGLE